MTTKKNKEKNTHINIGNTHELFKSNFYDYGMDVIEDRALPDVRDGLKPVHRAIVYEMLISNATSKNKFVKVAKITGAVIGNWHPHGDSAVEGALVGLAIPWKNTLPAIDIMGNQGSILGDPPAAGRYIEARLSKTGDAYGHKLKEGIVPYVPNFDNTSVMPTILPAQLPYLLINGISDGIAVGVASSLPPHNAREVIEMTIQYLKKPKTKLEDLLAIMPGPDFPSGATIINKSELLSMYQKGYGKLTVRATINYNPKEHSLHITEIPYLFAGSMDNLVAELVKASSESVDKNRKKTPPKVLGIKSVDDFSGKQGIDITISLMKDADEKVVLQNLYAKTRLETTVKFIFNALNNRTLNTYSLRQYLAEYTDFQHEIVTNEHVLEQASLEKRIEILTGRILAVQVIDEIVDVVKHSDGRQSVIDVLMNGTILKGTNPKYHKTVASFSFTELQAESIADIPLYQLNRLDDQRLRTERDKQNERLLIVQRIVSDEKFRHKLIIKRLQDELKLIEETPRKTQIIDDSPSRVADIEIPLAPLYVGLDKYGYVRVEEKPFDGSTETDNRSRVGFFDVEGNCWNLHMDITKPTKDRGTLSSQLFDTNERIVGFVTPINNSTEAEALFLYQDGSMKRTALSQYMTKTRSTKVNTRHKDKPLHSVMVIPDSVNIVTINKKDYPIDSIPLQTLSGSGRSIIPAPNESVLDISFKQGKVKAIPKKAKPNNTFDAVVVFDGSDTCTFDWSTTDTTPFEGLYVTTYQELIKSTLVFVHDDGTAKRVDGKQFEVKTKRTSLQANKTGVTSIYIDKAHNKTLIGEYVEGVRKRIDETKISEQSKIGGGVRVFHTPKYKLEKVIVDETSDLEVVSFATQPKGS